MKFIFKHMKPYTGSIILTIFVKFLGTVCELLIPYVLEHIIDEIVPVAKDNIPLLIKWGLLMFLVALLTWFFNAFANHTGIRNAHNISYDIRKALFDRTVNLSGLQFDTFGLPSLISRMTSDSYNVQTGAQQLQTLCVRAPMLLVGGIFMMLSMDKKLSLILLVMLPFLIAIMLFVSSKGIPLFFKVQKKLDAIVRIMREDITGIRVIKALSKTEYEKKHYLNANEEMAASDIKASTIMALPGPFMQFFLNVGLGIVVYIGAGRVNNGDILPAVILAFLTYFNMITMGVMGVNRIFISFTKSSASAGRIAEVINTENDQKILNEDEGLKPSGDGFIRFENVSFLYARDTEEAGGHFAGENRQKTLDNIGFSINKGESLGIIGPTGCGKSTIVNLLMRFYDAESGGIFIDGRDVRTYDKDTLHRMFGTVFQNDMIFQDTIRENIRFFRDITDEEIIKALDDAQALDYINSLPEGLDYKADIKGANLSGGQKQRLYIARALAGKPQILILDDSSSALDYKTDAALRKAIFSGKEGLTTIMIAQRISSVMNMTNVLVLDNGQIIGYGKHSELLKSCPLYKEIYDSQMGEMS